MIHCRTLNWNVRKKSKQSCREGAAKSKKKTANGGMLKAAYDIFEEAFFKGSSKKVYSSF